MAAAPEAALSAAHQSDAIINARIIGSAFGPEASATSAGVLHFENASAAVAGDQRDEKDQVRSKDVDLGIEKQALHQPRGTSCVIEYDIGTGTFAG